ncbi:hypothetical protein DUI87_09091 [Hirundo rustica rustica]|uniref:Uncharacterized protein n=1 Tax=Hirundo rustica rustica TaxID=333673 RepID=A0A3M0KLN2_HIRRU|nr:hypothetical protein DUI87_09091 [Hirundo rustica rustica]
MGCHPEGPGQAPEARPWKSHKVYKTKYEVLCLGWRNPGYQNRLGDEGITSSPAKKGLGMLVDEKLDMGWPCALIARKAKLCPGLHQKQHGQQSERGDCASLLCSSEMPRPHLECCNPALWSPLPVGVSPEEKCQDDQSNVAHLHGKAERIEIAQPGEKAALGTPTCSLLIPEGGLQESQRPFIWALDKGKWL